MFHLVESNQGVSLVQYIISQKLIQQREQLIDLQIKIDDAFHEDHENCEHRVIETFKIGLDSSPELDECIKSIQKRFPWSKPLMLYNIFVSVLVNIIFGWGLYGIDVYTDTQFSSSMFQDFQKNFTKSTEDCHQDFDNKLMDIFIQCKRNFSKDKCLEALAIAEITGEECFNTGQRFEDRIEWWNGGAISAIHIALPILYSILLWIYTELKNNRKAKSKTRKKKTTFTFSFKSYCNSLWQILNNCLLSLLRLPIPPLTKLNKLICDIKLFKINAIHPKDEKEKTDKESMETDCRKDLISHDNVVNTSLVVEASVESGFQFWFQTVYILPTILLSFIRIGGDAKWTDLFNWKMFSILMSFASFAWTFYTIRNRDKKEALKGITLNSFSSILSYNSFDIQKLMGDNLEKKYLHESSFFKQFLYFLIFAFLHLGLTLATLLNITDNMKLIDVNGVKHEFKSDHIYMMLKVGWIFFLLAWILNIIYYKLHPSAVDFRLERVKGKYKEYRRFLFGRSSCRCWSPQQENQERKVKTGDGNEKDKEIELRHLLFNEQVNADKVVAKHHIVTIESTGENTEYAHNPRQSGELCLETHL